MTVLSEERSDVDLVNSAAVVSVDRSEGSVWAVVVLDLEFPLESLKSSLKVDLLLDDRGKSKLNVSWKIVVSGDMSGWSVKSSVSQEVVLAWEHNLEELLEANSLVSIAVEEHNQVVELRVKDVVDAIVSQEVCELSG